MNKKEMFNRCLIPTIFLKSPSDDLKRVPTKKNTRRKMNNDKLLTTSDNNKRSKTDERESTKHQCECKQEKKEHMH